MVAGQFQDVVLQICGKNIVYIENYKKLLCYTDHQIRVMTKNGTVEVNGAHLQIRYYSKEDLEIRGLICSICFS